MKQDEIIIDGKRYPVEMPEDVPTSEEFPWLLVMGLVAIIALWFLPVMAMVLFSLT